MPSLFLDSCYFHEPTIIVPIMKFVFSLQIAFRYILQAFQSPMIIRRFTYGELESFLYAYVAN